MHIFVKVTDISIADPLPVLPSCLIPKVWGLPQTEIYSYIEFDNNKNCVIGGNRTLTSTYVQRLVHAMEVLYYETYGIHPLLVADAKLYLFHTGEKIYFPLYIVFKYFNIQHCKIILLF